ncbi:MAG: class I SAM-dependent methyltransferase [Burkholderiales bacterium]|nr:class I SAM-dependent methyltransferase [Burkholderiales bacterium]
MKIQNTNCCCCGNPMERGLADWHLQCCRCGYEAAEFAPTINRSQSHVLIDEEGRDTGLKNLRMANFAMLLARMAAHCRRGASLLDIGAAHGWFVKLATEGGWQALGLEPDHAIYSQAAASGANVREGFFPDALQPGETFEALVFNDVFEHIPDPGSVLDACKARMAGAGLLVLNLPSSRGALYRISKVLYRVGVHGFFERMWQKDLPSPHLHYFSAANLTLLCGKYGLACVEAGTLPSLHIKGLYARIAYVKSGLRWLAPLIWLAIILAYPVLRLAPSDIEVLLFKRPDGSPGG